LQSEPEREGLLVLRPEPIFIVLNSQLGLSDKTECRKGVADLLFRFDLLTFEQ